MRRRGRIHAKFLQEPPIAVLSVFKGLAVATGEFGLPNSTAHAQGAWKTGGLSKGGVPRSLPFSEGRVKGGRWPSGQRVRQGQHSPAHRLRRFQKRGKRAPNARPEASGAPKNPFHFVPFPSLSFRGSSLFNRLRGAGGPKKIIHPHRRSIGRGRWVRVIENHPELGLSRSIDLLSHPNPCDRLADRRLRSRSLPPLTEPVVRSVLALYHTCRYSARQ